MGVLRTPTIALGEEGAYCGPPLNWRRPLTMPPAPLSLRSPPTAAPTPDAGGFCEEPPKYNRVKGLF